MRLNQAFLHLLLEAIKSGALPLVDTLISGFHLSWTKLSNWLSMVFGIFDSLVDILQIGFRREGSSALDPLSRTHGTIFRWSRQSLAIVIFSLDRAQMVSKRDLLLYFTFFVGVFVLESHSAWQLIQNWFVQAPKFARYLAAWRSRVNLRLIQTLINRVLRLNWGEIERLFDAWIVFLVFNVLISPSLIPIILTIRSLVIFHIWICAMGLRASRPGLHRVSANWLSVSTKLSLISSRKLIGLLFELLLRLLFRWTSWSGAFLYPWVHAQARMGLRLRSWATNKGLSRLDWGNHLSVILVTVAVVVWYSEALIWHELWLWWSWDSILIPQCVKLLD